MSIVYLTGTTPSLGKVTPIIDGLGYFDEFFARAEELQAGDKLYLMNWAISADFTHRASGKSLLATLQALVAAGVDVRSMVWVNTGLFDPFYPFTPDSLFPNGTPEQSETVQAGLKSGPHRAIMLGNLQTVYLWRCMAFDGTANNTLENRLIINTLDSVTGGCHSKFALFLRKTPAGEYAGAAYTGGMDFVGNRYSSAPHSGRDGDNYWHDVMAKVEGTQIVEEIYHFYKDVWNENVGRKRRFNPKILLKPDVFAFLSTDTLLPCIPEGARLIGEADDPPVLFDLSAQASDHLVQSLRTVPDIYPVFGEPELTFAPEGAFEFRDAMIHAFSKAEQYIYAEDQAMNSLDLFEALHDALRRNSQLQVILITGADPADTQTDIDKMLVNLLRYKEFSAEEKLRFHYFGAHYTIHSKLFIVDDRVAIIGSAGFITRSLTTELEHAVAFIEAGAHGSIKALRDTLWEEHTGIDSSAMTLEQAVSTWESALGETGTDRRVRLDEIEFTDLSGIRSELPSIIIKLATGLALTDDELAALAMLEAFKKESEAAAIHYLTWEAPYASWLNPSSSPPVMGIPFIEKDRIAVNETAALELISSQISTVAWTYDGLDADPAAGEGSRFETRFAEAGTKTIMAAQTFEPGPRTLTYPFILTVIEASGVHWCARFQPSTSIDDLAEPFRTNVRAFLGAVDAAGLDPHIITTLRPDERAYLMAMAYRISKGVDPHRIRTVHANVPVSWVHYDSTGTADIAASRQAATDMVLQYDIGSTGAAYPSKHSEGTALDMAIEIPAPVMIRNRSNRVIRVKTQQQLTAVAHTYGIIRLGTSNHWSLSGH